METTSATPPAASLQAVRIGGLTETNWRRVGILTVLGAAISFPFFLASFTIFQFTLAYIFCIAVLGLNLLVGFNGQFSLGHGAFYAIGAYTSAIMIDHFGIAYGWTIPAAGVVTLIVGFLFGLPALRIHGIFLALATLALALAMPQILKYDAFEEWTGGVQGIILDKPEAPLGLPLNADQWLYFLTLFVLVIVFATAWNLLRGRTGRAIRAVRDHHIAAESMGINTALYKSLTFGVSAGYTGIAGALSAIVVQFVAPDSFVLFLSIYLLVGVVVGGLASIPGAIFGGFFIQYLPNFADAIFQSAPWAIFGFFLIGFMVAMPAGIAGLFRYLWFRTKLAWATAPENPATR